MEKIDNTVSLIDSTKSFLSDWAGAPVTGHSRALEAVSDKEDKVVPDHLDLCKRGFDLFNEAYSLAYLSYGPASAPLSLYNLTELFHQGGILANMLDYYEGMAYDSVTFRVTCSNPRGMVGGFFCGVFPWKTWDNRSFAVQAATYNLNLMTQQYLTLSPQVELVSYSEARDLEFVVPWQHNVDYLPRHYFKNYTSNSATNQLWPGVPVIWFMNIAASYVSSQSLPAQIRVYVTFDNLRFVGPNNSTSEFEAQSDFSMTGVPIFTATAVASELLTTTMSSVSSDKDTKTTEATYQNPNAVQLAYVGDSTVMGPPPTCPIFRGLSLKTVKHRVLDFLTRPQYLNTILVGNLYPLYANPVFPRGRDSTNGNSQDCTFLRYFSQTSSFWRGTIIFDIVILGHPMVEVGYKFSISYPPFSVAGNHVYSQDSILEGICSGTFRISVPMPFLTPLDHMPIMDLITPTPTLVEIQSKSSSMLAISTTVISTALDAVPTPPVAIFIRAGDDFQFVQPFPVGLGYVYDNLPPTEFEAQCGMLPVSLVFETRAKQQLPTNQMVAHENVEDWMTIWSRALPYFNLDVDNDPVVDPRAMVSPNWTSTADSAIYTLGANSSWWVTNDYLSFYSSLFLYYKGSIGYKVLCVPGSGYKYLSMSPNFFNRQQGYNTFSYTSAQLPPTANFGFGTVATDVGGQPVMDFSLPLRSTIQWGFTSNQQMNNVMADQYYDSDLSGTISTNVVLANTSNALQDALYRKVGEDFSMSVQTLPPPPTLWLSKGYDWS